MDLRKTHDRREVFDAFLICLAAIGAVMVWLCFGAGGWWRILGYMALAGEVLLVYGSFIEPRRLTLARYHLPLRHEDPVWIKIAFLSDFHAGSFYPVSWYERIAQEVQALQPDLIVLGGDYVVDRSEPVKDLKALAELTAPLGRFFVLGNHDLMDRPQDIRLALRSFGFEDLTNRSLTLKREGRELEIYGSDDHWYGKPESFRRLSKNIPHIVFSHEPDCLMDLDEGDTDMVIAGHTHGGQIRLPLIGALLPIPAKMGRRVDLGLRTIKGIKCVVSSGLGHTEGRMRLFSPPQIVVVEVGI